MKKIIVEDTNIRIDLYLSEKLVKSRSQIQKLIKANRVFVNGEVVKANYNVILNDVITINEELQEEKLVAQDIPLNIVYEDDYLIVINKASGMVTHPGAGNFTNTLVNALLHKLSFEEENLRPGIVHRLDKDTSGLLVVAKDVNTLNLLVKLFKKRLVKRKYKAIVLGNFNHSTGTIDAPIGRDSVNRLKMAVTAVNSKEATTHFKVLEQYNEYSLLELELETGRTHQIRVHLQYIDHPVYNDPLYSNKKSINDYGQYLHSYYLSFEHPITNKQLEFIVDPDETFTLFLNNLNDNK